MSYNFKNLSCPYLVVFTSCLTYVLLELGVVYLCLQILWPGGKFFLRVQTPQLFIGGNVIDQNPLQTIESCGSKIGKSQSGSFEQQLEAARRASDLKKLLFG